MTTVAQPNLLRFTEDHAWVQLEGMFATVGITAVIADNLIELHEIQLPKVGERVGRSYPCGQLHVHHWVSDLFSPVCGTVIAVNDNLAHLPELVSESPYDQGWLYAVYLDAEPVGLLGGIQYVELVSQAG